MEKILRAGLSVFKSISTKKTLEVQAKNAISYFVVLHIDGSGSYESIAFGDLKAEKSTSEMSFEINKLWEEYSKHSKLCNFDKRRVVFDEIERLEKEFISADIFVMEHSFKIRNKMGHIVVGNYLFVLDANLKILGTKKINKNKYGDFMLKIDTIMVEYC